MIYMGIDYHKTVSQITLLGEDGQVLRRRRIANRRQEFEAAVAGVTEPISAVFEATRNWTVVDQLLEGLVHERHMAHPLKVKLIAEARIKTDKLDSLVLAQLLRTGFLPESYLRPACQRADLDVLRQRLFFVRQQTAIKNRIHALVDRHLAVRETAMKFKDLFGRGGLNWLQTLMLTEPDQGLLRELLSELTLVRQLIAASDARIEALRARDGRIAVVDELPGIGRFFAALIVVEIGDIRRFGSAKKLCSYAGLVPSTYQSADSVRHGRLTKQGNKYLRWAAIEAVNHLGAETPLGRVRDRLRQKKSRNPAKAATARRLLTQIYYRLKEYEDKSIKE
jgi:transposase